MKKNNEEYNRLELVLMSYSEWDLMAYQPYVNRDLYIVSSTQFILYDIQPSAEQKMELIRRIVTNKIRISQPNKDHSGYFDDYGFWDYTIYDNIVIFNFLSIAEGMEHLAIPFMYSDPCDGVESFGYMDDGTILNAEETATYIEEQKKIRHAQLLESVSKISFTPAQNFAEIFKTLPVTRFIEEHFGEPESTEEVRLKFKELSKIHHPDKGGDVRMFRAIANAKQYLIDSINYKNGNINDGLPEFI